jgi:hypothetical protein
MRQHVSECFMKTPQILAEQADEYLRLQKQLRNVPLLAQGNVFATEPPPQAPRARTHYKWTRKLRGKTVSETLSKEQYEAFKTAIAANRRIEDVLNRIRTISQDSILKTLPDSPGKRTSKRS